MDEENQNNVERFLEEHGLDYSDLAILSGVEVQTVKGMVNGTLNGSLDHELAILGVVKSATTDDLRHHVHPSPAKIKTRRGRLPEGSRLMVVRADELLPGDFVSYEQPGRPPGSWWVKVEAEPEWRGPVLRANLGGEHLFVNPERLIRIARKLDAQDHGTLD